MKASPRVSSMPAAWPRATSSWSTPSGPPAVDADAAGFVVAWDGFGDIFARRLRRRRRRPGPAFQANTFTIGTLRDPDVALGAGGTSRSRGRATARRNGYGVFGRRYDGDGTPRGDDFRVNTYTTGNQDAPTIAAGAGGRFVIAWQSYAQGGDYRGVFAQRYDPSASTTTTTSVTTTSSSSVTTTSSTSTTLPPVVEHLFPIKRLSVKPGSRLPVARERSRCRSPPTIPRWTARPCASGR
jgi:hypothetical protein